MKQGSLIGGDEIDDMVVTETMVRLKLPYPPTVNHMTQYRTQLPGADAMWDEIHRLMKKTKSISRLLFKDFYRWLQGKCFVQTYKTKEAKEFKVEVWGAVNKMEARKGWEVPLKATAHIYPPDRRRRDSSNLWKIIEDSLQAANVFKDDSQIKEHHDYMHDPVPGGMVVVEIEVL